MTLEEIQYKAQSIIQEWKYDDSAPYVEFVEELATMNIEHPSEDLDVEVDKFFETMPVLEHENIFEDTFKNIARHFAQWQKEQMMKDAVDGIARPDDCEIWVNLKGYGYNIKDGDKIKIIIVKEKEK